jgi:hypothetical protein
LPVHLLLPPCSLPGGLILSQSANVVLPCSPLPTPIGVDPEENNPDLSEINQILSLEKQRGRSQGSKTIMFTGTEGKV